MRGVVIRALRNETARLRAEIKRLSAELDKPPSPPKEWETNAVTTLVEPGVLAPAISWEAAHENIIGGIGGRFAEPVVTSVTPSGATRFTPGIDWRGLLVRYMALVIEAEGITFLDWATDRDFDPVEVSILSDIESEAKGFLRG